MKKTFLAVLAFLTLLTGCFKSENTNAVSTDGSTSMEKVIGILGEVFTENNKGVNFTYNPTGSGSGIKAVSEGRCDIGLSSRELKAEELESGLQATVLLLRHGGQSVFLGRFPLPTVQRSHLLLPDRPLAEARKIATGHV